MLILSDSEIYCVDKLIMFYAFFRKRDPVTKLSLLKAYCSSFYGSVVWDLLHSSTDAFCAFWRKSLRPIWNLPHNTRCALLPLITAAHR